VLGYAGEGPGIIQRVCGRTCPNSRPHRTGLRPRFPTLFITPPGRETWGQPQCPYVRAANFTSHRIIQITSPPNSTLTLIKLCLPETCKKAAQFRNASCNAEVSSTPVGPQTSPTRTGPAYAASAAPKCFEFACHARI
jgi:hypothetical protein